MKELKNQMIINEIDRVWIDKLLSIDDIGNLTESQLKEIGAKIDDVKEFTSIHFENGYCIDVDLYSNDTYYWMRGCLIDDNGEFVEELFDAIDIDAYGEFSIDNNGIRYTVEIVHKEDMKTTILVESLVNDGKKYLSDETGCYRNKTTGISVEEELSDDEIKLLIKKLRNREDVKNATFEYCYNDLVVSITFNSDFKNMSLTEFNDKYNVNYTGELDIEEFTDYIESEGISYVYSSFCEKDVLEAYYEMKEESSHECELICVDGLFLALL